MVVDVAPDDSAACLFVEEEQYFLQKHAQKRCRTTGLRHEVAAEDAARTVMMMELCTEDTMGSSDSDIAFRGE